MDDFNKQLEQFNQLLKQDIDMCRKKAEELQNTGSTKKLSNQSGFDRDTPQRRVDCYFRNMINKSGHGFGKSMIRDRDEKSVSSETIIEENTTKNTKIEQLGLSGGRLIPTDNVIIGLEKINTDPSGPEAIEFKNKSKILNKVFPTNFIKKSDDDIRGLLINQLEGDKNIKGIRFREIEFKIKQAIEFTYAKEKTDIENIILEEKDVGIRDDSAPESSNYTYYNEYLDGFICAKDFELEKTIEEINNYKKIVFEKNPGEDLTIDIFNEGSEIYKQLFCFAWNKAKLITAKHIHKENKTSEGGSYQIGGQPLNDEIIELYNNPNQIGEYKGRRKPNLIVLTFGIIMVVFASVLVYQTWRNLYNTFDEIYYAGASADIYEGLNDAEAESTFTITTFFTFFKDFFLGTLQNNLLALEGRIKNRAQVIYDNTLETAIETNHNIWNRGWAIAIAETFSGYASVQIVNRSQTQIEREARREFDRTIENTQDQFKGYAAALGSVYLCSWIAINMFATGPIIILNQFFPELIGINMVYRSIVGLTATTGAASATASTYNLLGICTCLTSTADNYRNLYKAIGYIRNPEQRVFDLQQEADIARERAEQATRNTHIFAQPNNEPDETIPMIDNNNDNNNDDKKEKGGKKRRTKKNNSNNKKQKKSRRK